MRYRIARGGQVFGPYSEAEARLGLAAGRLAGEDLAQVEGAEEWVPLAQLLPLAVTPVAAGARLYPDPPDLPWWIALVLGVMTLLGFFVVWDIVEAAWLRKVERSSWALWLYLLVAALYVAKLPAVWSSVWYDLGFDVPMLGAWSVWVMLGSLVALVVARFLFRRELLAHFNGPEPVGLRLNVVWTLVFGGLYFQFKFNEINRKKRVMHVSVPEV
jgi:hypothetical protein